MTNRSKEMARKVRAAIEESGLSLTRWAQEAGLSPQALSSFLTGLETGKRRSATIDTAEKLAKAMGCSIAELLGEAPPTPSAPPADPWPELDAVLLYHPGRWHPDTIAAFRELRAYQGLGFAPQEIEKRLDELDEVIRRFLDDKAKINKRSKRS